MGNKSTYRLLTYDGLETVIGPTVQRLIDTLDLQSHLEKKTLISDQLKPGQFIHHHITQCNVNCLQCTVMTWKLNEKHLAQSIKYICWKHTEISVLVISLLVLLKKENLNREIA